jgi:hypothetical protein
LGFFGLAILTGLMTLGSVTGTLDVLDRKKNGLALSAGQKQAIASLANGKNIEYPAIAMALFFLIGMCLTIVTGFLLADDLAH